MAVVGVFLLSLAADAVASAGRIRSGVAVGGLELGGRSIEEANRLLTRRAKVLAARPALFSAQGQTVTIRPEQVGFFPDVDATLDRARRVGRDGSLPVKVWQRFRAYFASSDIGWRSDLDETPTAKIVTEWAGRFDNPGHEAGIRNDNGAIVPVDPLPGRKLDRRKAVRTVLRGLESWPREVIPLPFVQRGRKTDAGDARDAAERASGLIRASITLSSPQGSIDLRPAELANMLEAVPRKHGRGWTLGVRFSPDLVRRDLGPRMAPFEHTARDASFAVSAGTVAVRPSEDGLKFDAVKTAQALDEIAEKDAPRATDAAFTAEHPALSTDQAKDLHITEVVSTFTTRHPAGQPRVKNIHLMADTVDGTVVRPGEVFSLNRKVGERTADKGYVLAPMIYDGEFKDQIGGGVSQFATTMFNAVFFGGYEFVSYKAHSYYISRYPAGRDATVSWPAPDFKFRNDSSSGILIKTSYTAGSITVTFYGSKEGRKVDVETGERTNVTEPQEKRTPDPGVPPGQERVKQEGAQGFDIVIWRIITRDGKTKRQKFYTRYLPEPRIILFSTQTPGPATPAPSGGPGPAPTAHPGPAPTPTPTATPKPPGLP
jgi:vancomycin resistance protein YoaR